MDHPPLLAVKNLSVAFGETPAVRGVTFELRRGEMLALVGESGSGKSVSALSLLKLLPDYAKVTGEVVLQESGIRNQESEKPVTNHESRITNLLSLPERELRAIRGRRIGMIFQEPMTSLNPLHTLGRQLGEILLLHNPGMKKGAVRARITELLSMVELHGLASRLGAYPHELSGGQRQRVMIAMALANNPDILIADEPTTALDVTVQATVLNLIRKLQKEHGLAVLLITHDLTIVERIADRVAVMHEGTLVEIGETRTLFRNPQHAYTKKLLAAAPSGDPAALSKDARPLLDARALQVHFPVKRGMFGRVREYVKAVDGIDISLRRGETLGIVGESGSGKTTLGLALLRLVASEGEIRLDGAPIHSLKTAALRPLRQRMQFVFQDPFSSLNPRMSVGQIIAEGLSAHGIKDDGIKVARALADVGLRPEMAARYPHEFSGGQRQRIGIARALALDPELLVLDEPTSALDVSTQSDILAMLKRLQAERQFSYIFISHDLRVIKSISHRVLVMRGGKVVETGTREAVFGSAKEEYTQTLLRAAFEVK